MDENILLFGPRGSGKSTLLRKTYSGPSILWFDLLHPTEENRLTLDPSQLAKDVKGVSPKLTHVVIDEIQKIPKLLGVVNYLIESEDTRHIRFVLTGSSARKPKDVFFRSAANVREKSSNMQKSPVTLVLMKKLLRTTTLSWKIRSWVSISSRSTLRCVERAQDHDGIKVLPWHEALRTYFWMGASGPKL